MTSSGSRLPRGKHNLTRSQVEQDQRQRVLAAMVDTVAEKGYAHTAVSDIIAGAQVSRATFYQLFRDKDDCFRATYAWMSHMIQTAVTQPVPAGPDADGSDDPIARVEWLISSYLGLISNAPKVARAFLVEVYAADQDVLEERRLAMNRFGDYMADALEGLPGPAGTGEYREFFAQSIIDVMSARVTSMVGTGEAEKVRDLQDPLMALVRHLTGR